MAHRGQWSEHEARGVLSAWRKSGLSIERFGKEHGIVPQRIRWWKTKLEGKATALVRSEAALALLPVRDGGSADEAGRASCRLSTTYR